MALIFVRFGPIFFSLVRFGFSTDPNKSIRFYLSHFNTGLRFTMNYVNIRENILLRQRIMRRHLYRDRVFRDRLNPLDLYDDYDFKIRFRFTKQNVNEILTLISNDLQMDSRGYSVPPHLQLLLTLRFFATGAFHRLLGDTFHVSAPCACCIISKVSKSIAKLKSLFVYMPKESEVNEVKERFHRMARFEGVIGAVDGTHIRIVCPGAVVRELYWCRKNYYSINTQIVCDSNLTIRNIVARWPGSTHDSRIFNNSNICYRLQNGDFGTNFLLGDSGYPCRTYIITPYSNPQTRIQRRFNASHSRTRVTVERTIGVWKKRFPCIHYGLRCQLPTILNIIIATAVLHNLAIRFRDDCDIFDDIDDQNDNFVASTCINDGPGMARRDLLCQQLFS